MRLIVVTAGKMLMFSVVLIALWAKVMGEPAQAEQLRAYETEDLLKLQRFGAVAMSPDGSSAAVTVVRSKLSNARFDRRDLAGFDRADVFLVSQDGSEPITNGESDGTGFWSPQWSPDGSKLALLSTRGGDGIQLFVWHRSSGQLEQATRASVDTEVNFGTMTVEAPKHFQWINDEELLVVTRPLSELPYLVIRSNGVQEVMARNWDVQRDGREPSTSVLDSDDSFLGSTYPQNQLRRLNVTSGQSETVSEGWYQFVSMSPNGTSIFVVEADQPLTIPDDEPATFDAGRNPFGSSAYVMDHKTAFLRLDSQERIEATGVRRPWLGVGGLSPKWSPDGRQIAMMALPQGESDPYEAKRQFAVVNINGESSFEVRDRCYSQLSFDWLDDAVFQTANRTACGSAPSESPIVYNLVKSGTGVSTTVEDLGFRGPPHEIAVLGGSHVLHMENASLFASQPQQSVSVQRRVLNDEVERFEVLRGNEEGSESALLTKSDGSKVLVRIDGDRLSVREVDLPSLVDKEGGGEGTIRAASQSNIVVIANGEVGSALWFKTHSSTTREPQISINDHLRSVASPKRVLVGYETNTGLERRSLLLMPNHAGAIDPEGLIVRVYPGALPSLAPNRFGRKSYPYFDNDNILLSAGFAVLWVELPMNAEPGPYSIGEYFIGLIEPAVEKAIEEFGFDRASIGLFGHSYGGYLTNLMISHTDLFQAAASSAGYSDIFSHATEFSMKTVYLPYAPEANAAGRIEVQLDGPIGLFRFSSPVEATHDYMDASPIYRSERVNTPLLLLHGEFDGVSISHAEKLYSLLSFQDKRVRFVRYWGESHTLESPANIEHAVNEVRAWFQSWLLEE